ncbi:MAG: hypothetical protein AUJ92_02620 [Armatimonadetes bacterium CG2_30_59_28]|nr:hypothetical protein [Armatimonadota bacterium]OIO97900.1 MAG: hypothetical protein AUJ92_02620 [Armatimonadetes bacterium CG2_30_59_28]PIU65981.1 MAG: hypothetical protein COS85_06800 [Armatimonadetes bacterium CG07_land_8_20_14_0_80_59_28]PIX42402.1 MAG: hypothetical protein COZ56_09445 [Armatimonadetes bacterium CG_4_8_14_3_um_filter_58_9]PIY44139.1 MAG: hypothetical protein COZ05_09015 [Armatimonadetes bacterium CG_4_10_14_3_um_filter_59_10]PJB78516.1 MAG: hypothetical protein CO095_004
MTLPAESDAYSATGKLPADLPVGEYVVYFHNGYGGNAGWSSATKLFVGKPRPWLETRFNVKDFGATGRGDADDTHAVQEALAKAGEKGGVVVFPRGRYQITEGLMVPRFVALQGEKQEETCLFWPEMTAPPSSLIQGTNSFGIQGITIYASKHQHIIVGDLGAQPDAGDIFLRRVRVRANYYRGHLKPEEVDQRFRESLRLSTGGGDTVRMGGKNIVIEDCDMYGSGRALFLSRVRGGRVTGNTFYNGRWGWYCISGSDGLIFENNQVIGGDLMSTGGGMNCLDGSTYSQNVFYAHNKLKLMHGWDREAMTSDAGGEFFIGRIKAVSGKTMTLAEPSKGKRDAVGSGIFIFEGKGEGQYRRSISLEGDTVQMDHPWDVPPDETSLVGIGMFQGHYILFDNEFTDTGAMQFYGNSVECIVAGNRGTRMQGFRGLGLWYHGYQPSWFCQFVDNTITEGNYYHWTSATDSVIDIHGASRAPVKGALNRGSVVRGNQLEGNSHIQVTGVCRDVIIERNVVRNSDMGVRVGAGCAEVLVQENQFDKVEREVLDDAAMRKEREELAAKFINRQEPALMLDFEELKGGKFVDASGCSFVVEQVGGVASVTEGRRGKCAALDGTGFLQINEPWVFNAPDITIAVWVKPSVLNGRRGLVVKRYRGAVSPFVLGHQGANLSFEAAQPDNNWTFNFSAGGALKQNVWTHIAAVIKQGEGISLFVDGKLTAVKKNPAKRSENDEPLIIGREAWGGDPPTTATPGFYIGLMDELKVWTRALSSEEITAEYVWVAGQ